VYENELFKKHNMLKVKFSICKLKIETKTLNIQIFQKDQK